MTWLALAAAAVPFVFGTIRAIQTGSDFRYLWIAVAAAIGTAGVLLTSRSAARGAVRVGIVVFAIATVLAVAVAMLLGTRFGPGLLIVAFAFAFWFAVSGVLFRLGARRS